MNEELRKLVEDFEEDMKRADELDAQRKIRNEIKSKYEARIKQLKMKVGISCFIAGGLLSLAGYKMHNYTNSDYYKKQIALRNLISETMVHGGYKVDDQYTGDLDEHLETYCELEGDSSIEDRIDSYCEKHDLSDKIADMAKQKYFCYYNNAFELGDKIDLFSELSDEYKSEKSNKLSN